MENKHTTSTIIETPTRKTMGKKTHTVRQSNGQHTLPHRKNTYETTNNQENASDTAHANKIIGKKSTRERNHVKRPHKHAQTHGKPTQASPYSLLGVKDMSHWFGLTMSLSTLPTSPSNETRGRPVSWIIRRGELRGRGGNPLRQFPSPKHQERDQA